MANYEMVRSEEDIIAFLKDEILETLGDRRYIDSVSLHSVLSMRGFSNDEVNAALQSLIQENLIREQTT